MSRHSSIVSERVIEVRERIDRAALAAGRRPQDVTLVAATKTVAPDEIAAAVSAGITDVGENRAQELIAKGPELAHLALRWHFLGHLQRNKVRSVCAMVALWQSVDRASIGAEIARRAPGAAVLVEVNLAGEATKSGVAPEAAPALVATLGGLGLDVRGLMAIPPRDDDPRPWFAELARIGAEVGVSELSMGMSDDFESAIEHGATIVRIGRAIFGER